jgi:hypothetical protein
MTTIGMSFQMKQSMPFVVANTILMWKHVLLFNKKNNQDLANTGPKKSFTWFNCTDFRNKAFETV